MTCVVAVEQGDKVLVGADSAGVAGTDIEDRTDVKVFAVGLFLIGISGSFRVGQVLRFLWRPPEHQNGLDDEAFMIKDVSESLRKTFSNAGCRFESNGDSHSGPFLLCYRGKVYKVDSDFQIGRRRDGYNAVGSGSRAALGAVYALQAMGPKRPSMDTSVMVLTALEAAERFDCGVRRPFVLVEGAKTP